MSTTTGKLSAYAKSHKLVAGSLVTAVVALAAIGGVLAWSDNTNTTSTATGKPAVSAPKDDKATTAAQTTEQDNGADMVDETGSDMSWLTSANGDTAIASSVAGDARTQVAAVSGSTAIAPANPSQNSQSSQNGTTPSAPATPTTPATPTNPPAPTTPPAPVTPVANNLLANASAEEGTGDSATGWGTSFNPNDMQVAFTRGNDARTGSYGLHINVTNPGSILAANEFRHAQWAQTTAVSIKPNTVYSFSHYYKSTVANQVDVEYTNADGTITYAVLGNTSPATDWTEYKTSFTTPANAIAVNIYHAISQIGTLATDDYSLVEGTGTTSPTTPTTPAGPTTPTTPTNPTTPTTPATCNAAGAIAPLAPVAAMANTYDKARVSLTFDDGWKNIRSNGFPLLQECGFKSTQYLNSQPAIEGFEDYMTYAEIADFANNGHELGWHTNTHADLTTLDASGRDRELTPASDFITGMMTAGITNTTFKNFASPYGAYSPATTSGTNPQIASEAEVKASIMAKYGSHRSTDVGYNSRTATDVSNLKVQNILDSTTNAEVQGWIQEAVRTNSWLIIVYHEVKVDTNAAEENYSVTPANLAFQLSYLKQSGVAVQTVEQALAELGL